MKKAIISICLSIALVLSTATFGFAIGDVAAEEATLVNGDFESDQIIAVKQYDAIKELINNSSSGWFCSNNNDSKVKIEDDGTGNYVLVYDNVINNWAQVTEHYFPITEKSTGIYKFKFDTKIADAVDDTDKAQVRVGVAFLVSDGNNGVKRVDAQARSTALGATEAYNGLVEQQGTGWKSHEIKFDLYFRDSGSNWYEPDDILGIGIYLVQNFGGAAGTVVAPDDWKETHKLYMDNFTVEMPDKMTANTPALSADAERFPVDNGYANVTFNYADLYAESITVDNGDTEGNVYLEKQNGDRVNISTENITVGNKVTGFKINMDNLEHDTGYTLHIKNITSKTPVAQYDSLDPYFQGVLDTNDKRYIRQSLEKIIFFRTIEEITVDSANYSSDTDALTAGIAVNNGREAKAVYALGYKESNDIVSSPVSYKKVSVDNSVTNVTIEDVGLQTDAGNAAAHITGSLTETVDQELGTEAEVDVIASKTSSNISINGKLPVSYYGKKAEVYILKPNGEASSSLDISADPEGGKIDSFYVIDTIQIGDDGVLTYTSPECAETGTYKVILKVDNKVFKVSEQFISSQGDNGDFLDSVNAIKVMQGTEEQKKQALLNIIKTEDTEKKIRYNDTYYDMLDDKSKELLAENLLSGLPYADVDAFADSFVDQSALIAIIRAKDPEILKNVIANENKNFIGLTEDKINSLIDFDSLKVTSAYTTYDTMSDEDKKSVCSYVCTTAPKTNIRTAAEFKDLFNISLLNKRIADTTGQSEIVEIFDDHSDILTGLNYSGYKNLEFKIGDVNTAINQAVPFTSVALLVTTVNNLIAEANKSATQPSTPSYGGGGGGGYGGGIQSYKKDESVKVDVGEITEPEYFDDLSEVEWASEAINVLYERKIVAGKGDNKFAPLDNVTREEIVKMLILAANLQNQELSDKKFDDVEDGAWYSDYVYIARQLGIVNGKSETIFGLGENITREDLFVMCANLLYGNALGNTEVLDKFSDSSRISDYAVERIALLVEDGIVNGSDGLINPKASATRAEAAKLIFGLLSKLDK